MASTSQSSTSQSSTSQSSPSRLTIDICVSGYILTEKMVRHLCLLQYGATEAQLDSRGVITYSVLYFEKRKAIDAPYFIPLTFHDRDDPNDTKDLWLLPGKAAFFSPGVTPPNLPLDKETKAYLDHWFPPTLLGMKEFRGLRYIQTIWPRGLLRALTLLPSDSR